ATKKAAPKKKGATTKVLAKAAQRKPQSKKSVVQKTSSKRAASNGTPSHKTSNSRSPARESSSTPQIARRDRAGHFNPRYEAELRARSREGRDEDEVEAFVHGSHSRDDLAEELGEETIATMTTGEDEHKESLEEAVDEEIGGPFVETSSASEFTGGSDGSNPAGATREPFPKT